MVGVEQQTVQPTVPATTRTPPRELPREMAARFLGRVTLALSKARGDTYAELRQQVYAEIYDSVEKQLRTEYGDGRGEHARTQQELQALREAMGAGPYEPHDQLMAAVRLAREFGERGVVGKAQRMSRNLSTIHEQLGELRDKLSSLTEVVTPGAGAAEVPHGG
jgi:hypothetical protein